MPLVAHYCTVDRTDKWKEDFIGLEKSLSDDITELQSSLSSVGDSMKELTLATVRRIQQLSEIETRERNALENTLLREMDNSRDQFGMRWEKIERSITDNDNETKHR